MEENKDLLEDMKDKAAKEDNEMLIRMFVGMVGYNYVKHEENKEPSVHPTFSEDTKIYWDEIRKRLHETVILDFDIDGCRAELERERDKQNRLCKDADYASSYHYGLKNGYNDALRIIDKYIKRNKK